MLRYRAVENRANKVGFVERKLNDTDGNGRLIGPVAPLAHWASDVGNHLTRPIMEKVAGVHRDAALPKYHGKTFVRRARETEPEINRAAPAFGRKAVLYATCFINYNDPETGLLARRVLAHNGVETKVVYPTCCGMPQLEQGNIESVAERATRVASELGAWIDQGYDVVSLVPSCTLMLKSEWPLIVPADPAVKRLAEHTRDISEYLVDIGRKEGLAPGLKPLDGGVTVHIACHARAQNVGAKAADLLRLIPETEVAVIERCSGHGGAWGVHKENFETALKVGKPVARQAASNGKTHLSSECPLAATHIIQGLERIEGASVPKVAPHPVVLLASAYGFID
jgi:glycerol-3-phosphate dehydrogenase subunit C